MSTIRSLPNLVRAQFRAAQDSKDLTFYATQVAILQCNGLPFQLRFSPALANKPKSEKDPNKKPIDPFENPAKELFIADIAPEHYLVLNKFPVIPNHFILATKQFKEQTDLLEDKDLEAAWKCLNSYRELGEELFGFFNSGDHSGASQPHRHIQFLPVESMHNGIEDKSKWSVLADNLIKDPRPALPFTYFSAPLPKDSTSNLYQIYRELHKQAVTFVRKYAPNHIIQTTRGEESTISYNLGLTDRVMVLCPRLSEGLRIRGHDGKILGPIALNGTVLGGTLLVKNEEEWNLLRHDESKLNDILQAIGVIPKSNAKEGYL